MEEWAYASCEAQDPGTAAIYLRPGKQFHKTTFMHAPAAITSKFCVVVSCGKWHYLVCDPPFFWRKIAEMPVHCIEQENPVSVATTQ
jgi:hypothetical protein